MAKKRVVKDKDGKQVEIDQDAIDAALSGAVTMADGSHPKNNEKPYSPMDGKKNKDKAWYAKENLEAAEEKTIETPSEELDEGQICVGADVVDEVKEDSSTKGETPPVALSQQDFVKACYDLTINAKQCKYQSSKVEDKNIVEYIRSINKKIYDETQKGGFSTNVQFRVTPQDWVNVNHIFDWYKIRGFQVDVKDRTSSPYGKDVGTMNYNFTISWVDA
jgi:hypothetical protein